MAASQLGPQVASQVGSRVASIDETVAAKLVSQRAGEDAGALWEELWSAYGQGGVAAVEARLQDLLETPGVRAQGDEA